MRRVFTLSVRRLTALGLLFLATACDSTTPEEHLRNAEARLNDNALGAAVIELKNALKKQPDYAEARLLLGEAYLQQGDYNNALKELERAGDLGLTDERSAVALLTAKLGLGRRQEVIGALAERKDLAPALAVLLADAYLQSGDVALAEPLYQANTEEPRAQIGLAAIAWQEGDVAAARRHFDSAIEMEPNNFQSLLKKGEFELNVGDEALAQQAFAAAQALPGGEVLGQVGVVRVLLAQQDVDAAAGEIRSVLDKAPGYPVAHYLNALIAFQQSRLDEAERSLREIQRTFPGHVPSMYLMGLVNYQSGQLSQAKANLRRYLAQEPANESARKLLASVEFEGEEYESALETLAPLANASEDPQVFAMIGSARMRLGDAAGAVEALERAVDIAPDMAPFRNQLALSLLSIGEDSRARDELDSAIKVDQTQFQSDYLLAMVSLRDKDYDAAERAIDAIVQKTPDSPIGYNLRGALALGKGDRSGARAAFQQAIERQADFLPAVTNLARLDEAEQGIDAAVARYETLLQKSAENEGALLALADLKARQGKTGEAVALLERAVLVNPDNLRARLGTIRLYTTNNEREKAGKALEAALERAPESTDLLILEAELALRQGQLAEATTVINKLQSKFAQNPANPVFAFVLGRLQAQVGNLTLARSNFEQVLDLENANPRGALLELGRLDLQERNLAAARKRLEAVAGLEGDTPSAQAELLRGDLLAAEGHDDQAAEVYKSLRDAGSRDGMIRLATLELRRGDTRAGAAVLQRWLDGRPGDQGVELLLAGALLQNGDQTEAIRRYESLLETGNPIVLNNLAWLYMEQGNKQAVDLARQAHERAPGNADIADTLGWILVQQGSESEGIQILRESLRLKEDNPTVLYHLGVAYQRAGDAERAGEMLRKALTFGDFTEAEEARKVLENL